MVVTLVDASSSLFFFKMLWSMKSPAPRSSFLMFGRLAAAAAAADEAAASEIGTRSDLLESCVLAYFYTFMLMICYWSNSSSSSSSSSNETHRVDD